MQVVVYILISVCTAYGGEDHNHTEDAQKGRQQKQIPLQPSSPAQAEPRTLLVKTCYSEGSLDSSPEFGGGYIARLCT